MSIYVRKGLDVDDKDVWLVLDRRDGRSECIAEFYCGDEADKFVKNNKSNNQKP
jgi:hypothetical protein